MDQWLNDPKLLSTEEELTHPPAWTSKLYPAYFEPSKHTLWATVWIRVNCASALYRNHSKVKLFVDAHVDAVRYLDTHGPEATKNVPYVGLGRSTFDDDRNLIRTTVKRYQVRTPPLQILRQVYPNKPWIMEEVTTIDYDLLEKHDYKVPGADERALWIMLQCKLLYISKPVERNRNYIQQLRKR